MPLTARTIEAAAPRDKPYKLADAHGLYLFVSPTGSKSWRANSRIGGKQVTQTYGRWPGMSLADARRAHHVARDPAAQAERKAAAAPTFAQVADDWLRIKLPTLSNPKHQHQVQSTLTRFALPALGKLPLHAITRPQLVEVVRAAQAPGRGGADRVETARRLAGRITAVFDYAVDAGLLQAHPAASLTRVLQARRVRRHMPAIPAAEAGALMRGIDDYDEPITRLGLQLAAHTFARVSELRLMRWDELRENGGVWVAPALHVKGSPEVALPHVVPLSRQARAVLEELGQLTGDRTLVLDSPRRPGHPLSENTLLFALYRLGYRGRMTVHGFRALASTVLNEHAPFHRDAIERQLQHKETDEVRAAYHRAQYLDQRRELMQWWSDWLDAAKTVGAPALPAPEA